ncbi:right-handed parallel beta-helix repeat-containing protein, partial [Caldisericum exile]|uniref:right-handed parallel beta-helix repeat-containing protein n=1 Tax=Caldisericum exile TaxID=693075 RepID=UPI003C734A4F
LSTSVSSGSGSIVAIPSSDKYLPGDKVTLNAVPDAGWHFVSWSGDASGTMTPTVVTMDANKTVSAAFVDTTNVYVDDNWAGSTLGQEVSPGKFFGYNAFAKIQDGINAVNLGGTVYVAAGTYTEQILIQKSLKLIGEGADKTIIKAPSTLPPASDPSSSIVIVSGAGVNAEISGFTIEGPGPSSCGSIGSGIFVRDGAYAYIHYNKILDIRDSVFSGCQNGIAIQIGRKFYSTSGTATIENNTITGYQKGGIVVDNTGSSATISKNVITGAGTTDVTAQNGIQISRGATATISGNTVSGNSYHKEGDTWDYGACGILLYQSGSVSLTGGNILTGNDTNYYAYETGTLSLGAEVFGHSTAPVTKGYYIVLAANANLDASSCTFEGINPASATLDQLFTIEDRIWHAVDDPTYSGLVRVKPGNIYVTNTEPTAKIQYGINAATPGDTVNVAAGTYVEGPQIVIDKNLSIIGADKITTIIQPSADTGTSGDARGWWLVNSGVTFSMSKVTLDGTGKKIWQAIRAKGTVALDNVNFMSIQYDPSTSYQGTGIAIMSGTSGNSISNCTFMDIGRIGVIVFGSGTQASITNNTYTGKGSGNWLDYGIEVGGGGQATITNNTITNCKGVASDSSTSAGILVTTYYGAGTTATITHNTITGNLYGITVGYDSSDTSVVVANYNNISGNTDYGVNSTAPMVNAKYNWWGDPSGPYDNKTLPGTPNYNNPNGLGDKVTSNVDYAPWAFDNTLSTFGYLIRASSSSGGTISPSGNVLVQENTNQSFTMTANTGCFLSKVIVDGVIVFPAGMNQDSPTPVYSYTYTFTNVTADHTIQAVFAPGILQYMITATAGTGGTISPSGNVFVPQFGSQTFIITPNTDY